MGLSSVVKEWYIKTIPGMNSKVEDFDLKDKWVEAAQNCRFEDEPGALNKREPSSFLNTIVLGGTYDAETQVGAGLGDPVVGVYRYYTSGGLTTWVAVSGTSAYTVTDAGVYTEIRSSLTDAKRCSFETYQDLLIVSNGFDNAWVWDGAADNVTWELGGCKAVLGAVGGNLDANSTYFYAVTYDGDTSNSGAVSNTVTTDGTNLRIELSQIPLGPVGTTDRKIYRTEGNGSALKLLTTLADNTTTTFSDNVADGSLTTAYPAVTDDMPKGSILKLHRERLFISADPNNPSKIYYSNPYLPHYIQQTTNLDFMEISPDDGDEIMGIPIQLEKMICIKKNTIRKVHVTSAVSGADPTTWYADDPIAWIGSPAQWSITQTPQGVVFLGWDHWYLFDGASAHPVFDEFDTGDILESNFSDVVGFWHKENFIAGYTDKTSAAATHNRLLVYNLKREALSYDLFTGIDITGPNCFGSRVGDDEVGDLYVGDSVNGFVLKEKDTNSNYRLRTKTEANNYYNLGDGLPDPGIGEDETHDIFVGGTENRPYIELGAEVAPDVIPDDIIIFWDNEVSDPGSGWTEITGNEDMLINVSASSPGSQNAGTSHSHTLSGTIPNWTAPNINLGDGTPNSISDHSHTVSAPCDPETPIPRHVKYRMFKKNNTTVEEEFPDGAIVLWDQGTPPEGWSESTNIGYYIIQGTTDLADQVSSQHNHTFTNIPTSTAIGSLRDSDGPANNGPRFGHNHTITGIISTETLDTWEVDYIAFALIKKVGETSSWDGVAKYCYALFAEATAPSNGWSDESATYEGRCLKIGDGAPVTGDEANANHNHTAGVFETSTESAKWGNGGYHTAGARSPHTHTVTLSSAAADAGQPPSVNFRLFKRVLGTMKVYNNAGTVSLTAGTWVSPCAQIDADTLLQIAWNETLVGADDIILHTRTGSTQVACEAASWSPGLTNANGTDIPGGSSNFLQYKIEFTATDSTVSNPRVSFIDGYVVKYEYHGGTVVAETSVNFRYRIGLRNFNMPSMDKIFKKIISRHVGSEGSFNIIWETENASGSFTIPLDTFPTQWDSYFPSTAYGKEVNFEVQKNDLHDFKLSEIKGLFSPHRTII